MKLAYYISYALCWIIEHLSPTNYGAGIILGIGIAIAIVADKIHSIRYR